LLQVQHPLQRNLERD